jgi:two-component system cell cycle sensor histidine kinase/response regulator CckA
MMWLKRPVVCSAGPKRKSKFIPSYEKKEETVAADQGQIEQVLLNMYVNAWQAMPTGGELYIKRKT